MSFLFEQDPEGPVTAEPGDLASVSYKDIPYIERRWLWPGYVPVASPCLWAAAGGTGKGMLFCAVAARTVLGLPFPGEDRETRREPGRVVWIAGSEDDPFEDLAPRFRAAIAAAVAEFGLDPELAEEGGAISLIHDLSEWRDGSPFEVPGDMGRLLTEVSTLNALGGPQVALTVLDPLADLLGEHDTISTVKGARWVAKALKLFAREADVALPVIHHLTKDGKVSGSPAVLDALRLAFRIELSDDDPSMRMIIPVKANIVKGEPQRYTITGRGPGAHAVFVDSADERERRVSDATARSAPAAPAAGSTRARLAALADAREADAGPYKLLRETRAGRDVPPARERVGGVFATRDLARAAAVADAGTVLAWHASESAPGTESAGMRRADGAVRAYAVSPLRKPARRAPDPAPAPAEVRAGIDAGSVSLPEYLGRLGGERAREARARAVLGREASAATV